MMETPMRMDVEAIADFIRKRQEEMLKIVRIREETLKQLAWNKMVEILEYSRSVIRFLYGVESKCVEIQGFVVDFLTGRSKVQQFEESLKESLRGLTDEHWTVPTFVEEWHIHSLNMIYIRVQSKVDELKSLVENAVNKETNPSLSPTLDTLMVQLNDLMQTSAHSLGVLQSMERSIELGIAVARIMDETDFRRVGDFHASVLDKVDFLERSVYDATVPHLTDFEKENLAIGRPNETPNIVGPLSTTAEMCASIDRIVMRLKTIENVCSKYLGQEITLFWINSMTDEDAGDEANQPQTAEPQTVEPKTVEPQTVEPQTVEPQANQPETAELQRAANSSGGVLD